MNALDTLRYHVTGAIERGESIAIAEQPPAMNNFTRIKNDVNGNPRFVTSWLGYGFATYEAALTAARKIGGRKFHNKQFGGGIVFQAYECELADIARRLAM